jgi:hypothetical protein
VENIEVIYSIFLGIGLAASVGFRIFLPLLLLSIAGFYNVIPLTENWEWIGSITAIITLGFATLIEIVGYYIPWVDNLLDTIALPLTAVAGTIVMLVTVAELDPVISWTLAIIAGGGTATAIQGGTSSLRLASTATTGGIGNSIVATLETGSAILLSILAIFIPIAAFIIVVFIFFKIFRFFKMDKKKRPPSP